MCLVVSTVRLYRPALEHRDVNVFSRLIQPLPPWKQRWQHLVGWVCECFFWRTVQDCFVQVVSLYPAEIKSLFVPCRDKVCQSLLWMCLLRCLRERERLLLFGLTLLTVSSFIRLHIASQAQQGVYLCVCLLTFLFKSFAEAVYSSITHFPASQFHVGLVQYFMIMWLLLHHICQVQKKVFCVQSVIYQIQQTVFM